MAKKFKHFNKRGSCKTTCSIYSGATGHVRQICPNGAGHLCLYRGKHKNFKAKIDSMPALDSVKETSGDTKSEQ